jgi:hypothetical protein
MPRKPPANAVMKPGQLVVRPESAEPPPVTAPPAPEVKGVEPPKFPLGIHFGLDEDAYHRDPGLGSTDLRRLAKNPQNYWFKSWMNPLRSDNDDDSTESKDVGDALHKFVLEGRAALDRLYVCGPLQAGMTTAQKQASTRAAKAEHPDKTVIKWEKFARILIAGAMISKNPYLAPVFNGGHSEVSFFWERDGVRLKARFDYLKCSRRTLGMLAGNGDLKSVANQYEKDFKAACYDAIATYRYDAQAALYLEGLTKVPAAIDRGAVFGEKPDEEWLQRFLDPNLRFGWQWIFYQMTGAPITHSMVLSPQNPLIEDGMIWINQGIDRYRQCMKDFGTDMWLLLEQPREATRESMPGWFGR